MSIPFLTGLHHGDSAAPRLPSVGRRQARAFGKRVKRFGRLLEELRKTKLGKRSSLDQVAQQLAERGLAPLSDTAIHRYENEGRVPDVLSVMALADLYGESEDWLLASLRADLRDEPLPPRPSPLRPAAVDGGDDAVGEYVAVPVLADRIAAGPPLIIDETRIADHLAFSQSFLNHHGITRPICVRVGRYERSMMPTIQPGDTVLLDCADSRREQPKKDRIYAVNVEEGSTLKRVTMLGNTIALISDNIDKSDYYTRTIELDDETEITRVIIGQVMWKGQPL